ncbi:class C sortase [Microbacterium sp. zg-Y818]|uniref:class C sortase n=1 Tax=unclassified Microbacterium TaxID=2609290 RepID=UPI00214B5B78|nr:MULTISPECIES: class C sortase [unclassified Microbacterium]MCR2799845.1 class C sortase [Microbacterium sp. zg.Y818]WIM21828.1 class C sortase [Microbacterium sp. zg-Y818]
MHEPRSAHPRRPGLLRARVLVVALVVAGVAIMIYPSAASWFSDLSQRDRLQGYAETIDAVGPAELDRRLAASRAYNAALGAGIARDPFGAGEEDTAEVVEARELVTDEPDGVLAQLRIPAIDAALPVYSGTSDATLERGIGHLTGSSLPVGGAGTHAVLTGHRGYPQSALFTHLDRLTEGDTFTLTVLGQTLAYRVTETQVVEPDDVDSLRIVPGRDLVTLVTCTPIGINSHRILVHAERTSLPAEVARFVPEVPVPFPWWALALAVTVAGGTGALVWRRR